MSHYSLAFAPSNMVPGEGARGCAELVWECRQGWRFEESFCSYSNYCKLAIGVKWDVKEMTCTQRASRAPGETR